MRGGRSGATVAFSPPFDRVPTQTRLVDQLLFQSSQSTCSANPLEVIHTETTGSSRFHTGFTNQKHMNVSPVPTTSYCKRSIVNGAKHRAPSNCFWLGLQGEQERGDETVRIIDHIYIPQVDTIRLNLKKKTNSINSRKRSIVNHPYRVPYVCESSLKETIGTGGLHWHWIRLDPPGTHPSPTFSGSVLGGLGIY